MSKFKNITLTKEQDDTIGCIKTKEDAKVQAPAGSGKTFTLEAAAAVMPERKGFYIAFNRAIADSAKTKFNSNVQCRTGHSVAFGAVGRKYADRLNKITGTLIAKTIPIGDTSMFVTPPAKGYVILDTIRRFTYSSDRDIMLHHVPRIKGPYQEEDIPAIRKDIVPYAKKVWENMADERGSLPITHDVYMKLWALSKPKIKTDFILLDEAQDSNAVILDVIMNQDHAQKILVGDKFQQIYEWRGAKNAMDMINTPHSCYITQSFRFGNEIAGMANQILGSYMSPKNRPPLIRGLEGKKGLISMDPIKDPDVIICRTNAGVISNVFDLLDKDVKVYVQGGVLVMINMLKGAKDLQKGKRTYVPDLALFSNWEEVMECSKTESGMDLRSFVNMVKTHGVEKLIEALQACSLYAAQADITVSTCHKCKGLEWETVKLHSDFTTLDENKHHAMEQSEINTLYVGATRALTNLDISKCVACHPDSLKIARNNFE